MPKLSIINTAMVTLYLLVSPTLTALVYEHVIDSGLALIIAGGVTSVGASFHLGQAAVALSSASVTMPSPIAAPATVPVA